MALNLPLKMLKDVANEIIYRGLPDDKRSSFTPVSDSWTLRFTTKHGINTIKQKPIKLARKEAHQPDEIRSWFDRYEQLR